MAELAASVGHQLIHVDYDNNKHNYNNDNTVYTSSVRRTHHDQAAGGAGGGSLGCLLDLNPNDFQSQERPPVPLSVASVDPSGSDPSGSAGEDSTQLSAINCDATNNTPCARCGLQLYHHHHHHHLHHLHHRSQPPHQPLQSLDYGQLCADGSLSDDRYPVGLRTPQ